MVGDLYVQVFRNIPGVALLIIIVYALPNLRVVLDYRTCVVATTVLMGSAFGSENFMSGINTIGVGQIEAARSIGLSFGQILRKIVIPQALRTTVLPGDQPADRRHAHHRPGSQVPLNPCAESPAWCPLSTRATGGILAFLISALAYVGSAFVIGLVGNRIDKKVRILR